MDEAQKARIIEKVRKMLNYDTQRGLTSDAEVDNYLAAARRMMDQWNIQEAEVYSTPEGRAEAKQGVNAQQAYSRTNLVKFMVELAWAPSLICDVQFVVHSYWNGGRKRQAIRFVGPERDIAVASELYKELLATMRLMCAARYGDSRPPEYNSYCLGFTLKLVRRAQELKASSATTAIVLANKAKVISDWMTENYGELRNRTNRAVNIINSAYVNGAMDGEKVELNTDGIR